MVKNHNGKKNINRTTLGLANTTRPKSIPEIKKSNLLLFSWAARSDAIKRSERKITTVGARRIPV